MKQNQRLTRTVLQIIARSNARSPLFWWMVDHHDEIIAAAAGERIRWAAFCAEAARLGLTDTRGRPPTERNARETWRQARRVVARARLREAGPRHHQSCLGFHAQTLEIFEAGWSAFAL